jgi:hypothetical protein
MFGAQSGDKALKNFVVIAPCEQSPLCRSGFRT